MSEAERMAVLTAAKEVFLHVFPAGPAWDEHIAQEYREAFHHVFATVRHTYRSLQQREEEQQTW